MAMLEDAKDGVTESGYGDREGDGDSTRRMRSVVGIC